MSRALLTCRDDLKSKHLGSVTADLTRVIWIKMLTRLFTHDDTLKKLWKLRPKFNSALEAALLPEKYMHVIELDSMQEMAFFDRFGNLSSAGKHQFWSQLMKSFQKMDYYREDTIATKTTSEIGGWQFKSKLPTPPPRHR